MGGFKMSVLALCFTFYFARASQEECGDSTNRDVWQYLEELEYSSLLYSTYDSAEIHCVNLKRTSLDPDDQSADLIWTQLFKNGTTVILEHHNSVGSCPYDLEIHSNRTSDTSDVIHAQLVYSDYHTCEILRLTSAQSVCRMWALNGASEDDIAECREILDSECPGEVYDVYPEDECSKP